MSEKHTIFGRRYGINRAFGAYYMAVALGHIEEGKKKKVSEIDQSVGLMSTGVTYATYTGLVNNLASSVVNVSSIVAVLVSLFALYISIRKD